MVYRACASAPGKVILFGEHAVVFGEPAVAAALSDLRITVKAATASTRRVRIRMPDLPNPIDVTFHSLDLQLLSLHEPPTKGDTESIHKRILEQMPGLDELCVSALTPLIYLINKLIPNQLEAGLYIQVKSQELPVGAGLGSSAAFGVACSAALLRLSLLLNSSLSLPPLGRPTTEHLETIHRYSLYSEIILHGTPSGIDNAVSTFGGAMDYSKTDGITAHMEQFEMPSLELILVNTHVPRSTKQLVSAVRNFYDEHPLIVANILSCIGNIAREFRTHSAPNHTNGSNATASTTTTTTAAAARSSRLLVSLVRTNQHLLRALGVSHPSLDWICAVVDAVSGGTAAAKLTGAGGGGCAMILLPIQVAEPLMTTTKQKQNTRERELSRKIQDALQFENKKHSWKFTCLRSSVGQDGVLWVDPDSFPNMTNDCSHSKVRAWTRAMIAVAAATVVSVAVMTRMRKR